MELSMTGKLGSFVQEPLAFLKQVFTNFSEDECPQMAASLAYYTIFALPPLLVIVLNVAGFVLDPGEVQGHLSRELTTLMGQQNAETVQGLVERASQHEGSIISTILGVIALLFGATGGVAQLQAALNKAWEVQPDPDRSTIKLFLLKRVFSFGLILILAFLLLVSLSVSAMISAMGSYLTHLLPENFSAPLLEVINFLVSLVVIGFLFACLFKYLPDAKIAWKDVGVGALATTILFLIGKSALGIYLGNSGVADTYGAAGSLVLILVWIYYNSMIVLLGAEFTEVWADRYGRHVRPSKGAVKAVQKTEIVRPAGGSSATT